MISSTWIALNLPAIQAAAAYARRAVTSQRGFDVLTVEEATELEAIAAQIFPTDDTPGAREAEIVHFLDRVLGSFASGALDIVRTGLAELQSTVREQHREVSAFSRLDFDRQTETLREIEDTGFFSVVRNLTVTGMFADPSYGGNQDEIGWKILGFDKSPVFRPPFGYYDREYGSDAERE